MQTIPLEQVVVPPSRQRTSTDQKKFEDLIKSIQEEGLFHAIVLDENDVLVAGATRYRAVEVLNERQQSFVYDKMNVPRGEIPFTRTHKTDEISLCKIELEENLRREELSPIDQAAALSRLHKLREANAPSILPGFREPVTLQSTAAEVLEIKGEDPTNPAKLEAESARISDSILVDEYKDHPDVKGAKSFKEAARMAKKVAEREFREIYGSLSLERMKDSPHKVIHGECQQVLPGIPTGLVDVIIADPPYGVGADRFGEQSAGHEYTDDALARDVVLKALEAEAHRICKPDAGMFIFCDILDWDYFCEYFKNEWYVWPTPLIWHKTNRGHAPQPKRGPSRHYEAIAYFIRGERSVRKVGSDVLTFGYDEDRLHGAQKPIGLYTELLSWLAYPGDIVLDPCAGSGPIIAAAGSLDCSAIAVERDAGFISICNERVDLCRNKSD